MRRAACSAVLLLALAVSAAEAVERRVALVIGNGAYVHAPALPNPANDAHGVAAVLRDLGFEVEEAIDLDRRAMESAVSGFARRLDGADAALFFYAGHGLQVRGANYLVPVDAAVEHEADLPFQTVPLDYVLARFESAGATGLVFLDACRDNPLARRLARGMGATRSPAVGRGLAPVRSGLGTLIAYATDPDNVARDGDARNSPFSAALIEHLPTPGLEVRSMLGRVRRDVIAATGGRQVPWTHESLLEEVYLLPTAAVEEPEEPAAEPAPAPTPGDPEAETAFWDTIRQETDPAYFEEYLRLVEERQFTGVFAGLARLRLKALERELALGSSREAATEPARDAEGSLGPTVAATVPEPTPEPSPAPTVVSPAEAERDGLRGEPIEVRNSFDAERERSGALETRLAALNTELETGRQEAAELRERLAASGREVEALSARLEAEAGDREALERELTAARNELAGREREIALLDRRGDAVQGEVLRLLAVLRAAEEKSARQAKTIADQGDLLGGVTAASLKEMQQFRSEFFGRLRTALGDRRDIEIVGDRFVLPAEILFASGSAELGADGRAQLAKVAKTLKDVAREIPPDVAWVLRIDGHTDRVPVSGNSRYVDNWVLSAARALVVVDYLIGQGVPPRVLSANALGEFHPLDDSEGPAAYQRNRRIEFKLTQP